MLAISMCRPVLRRDLSSHGFRQQDQSDARQASGSGYQPSTAYMIVKNVLVGHLKAWVARQAR